MRTTKDEFEILGEYPGGWETVTVEDRLPDAVARVQECRRKDPQTRFKYQHRRISCDDAPTRVSFRVADGEVFAVFPILPGTNDSRTMQGYAHVGQHCTVSEDYARGARPATEEEYAPLLAELKRIGYDNLVIVEKITAWHRSQRIAALSERSTNNDA